ncbi:hypothetical protein UCMB321_5580 [Pseudomonas batumici]|uniref:Uncharacterized protein n=1 Tax=Pseudomonas batumici TaxID=226910 RepID=A0A0C2I6E1_9PSED|nr:hypothetical protein UCMB321_5580 [Pseudomonas batumici]
MDHRQSIRRTLHLRFKQPMNRLRLRIIQLRRVEPHQQLLALTSRQDRQALQRRLRRLLQSLHQMLQRRVHIAADPLRTNRRRHQGGQVEAITQIVDVQGQRVVGPLFTTQDMDTVPGPHGLLGNSADSAMPVVEQAAEQWRRRGHAAATLGQGQGRMFVPQQRGQPRVGRLDPGAHTLPADGNPQRQGIDKHPQRPIGTLAALHPAHQHGTEHHIPATRDLAQYLGPGQVYQAGDTHPQLPGLSPQALVQLRVQRLDRFLDIAAIALHILQTERQGRLLHLTEHVAEKRLMIGRADTQARLGHIVAIRHRHRQGLGLTEQPGLHFMLHHLHRHMVQGHVMEQQHRGDPLVERIFGIGQAHQRRLAHVQAVVTRVETAVQLRTDIAGGRIEFKRVKVQARLAPDHLHRRIQAFPDHAGTQNVVTVDNALQGLDKGVQAFAIVKGELALQHIGVAVSGRQVVIENPLLQRRQRVDVLHIGGTARHRRHHLVDLCLGQVGQRQQVRGDPLTTVDNQVGRHMDFTTATDSSGQRGQGRLAEQHAHVGTQAQLTHALDQADGQQRVPAQFEEVIVTPNPLDFQQLGPQPRQGDFQLALGGLELTAGISVGVGCRQGAAIELTVGGQRERFEDDEGTGHHVFGQGGRQFAAQIRHRQVALVLADQVGHQTLVSGFVLTGQHHRLAHARTSGQARFDLAQFDTETTNLHLVVVTPEVLDNPVRGPASEVAGAIQQGSRLVAERVGDELRGVQFRAVQVTLGHALPTDIQLAGHAHRHRLAQGIEHIDLAVADWPANGNTAIADRGNLVGRGKGGGFGRAVAVEQMLRSPLFQYPGNHRRVEHIAADDQVAQLGESLHQAVGILMEQPGGHPQHTDRLRQQQRTELVQGQQYRLLHHDHATAIEQWRPDIQGAGVKGRVGGEGHAIADIEIGIPVVDHQAADGPVRHQYPFGRTGGAGGVHDIGHRLGGRGQCRVRHVGVQLQGVQIDSLDPLGHRAVAQGQHLPRRAVVQHECLAFRRRIDIQRHIGRAAFDNRQLAGQQVEGALQQQRHPLARLYAEADQVSGQAIGPAVELPIGQAPAILDGGHCVGPRHHLLFEQCLQAAVSRIVACRGIEAVQHLPALGRWKDFQVLQGCLWLLFQGLDQGAEGGQHIVADALCTDLHQGLDRQAERFAQVVHRQGDRVGALFFTTKAVQTGPGLHGLGRSHRLGAAVAVVEQRTE